MASAAAAISAVSAVWRGACVPPDWLRNTLEKWCAAVRFGGSPALCVVAHRIDTPPDPLAGFGVLGILYMQVAAG